MQEERNLEKLAKMSLGKKIGIGASIAFTAPTVVDGAKKGIGELGAEDIMKKKKKIGFTNGTMSLQQNIQKPNDMLGQNNLGSTNNMMLRQAQEDNNEHFKDAYKFLPVGAALTLGGATAYQLRKGNLKTKEVVKPFKQVMKQSVKPYRILSNFSNIATNAAKRVRANKDAKEEFARYVARTGDNSLTEEGFAAMWKAFNKNRDKLFKNNEYDFDEYVARNKKIVLKDLANSDAKDNLRDPQQKLTGTVKKFAGPFATTFNDALNGFIVGGSVGTGLTLGSLAINAAGDEYYKKKDNAELRKAVRNHWNNNVVHKKVLGNDNFVETNGLKYYTPEEKIERIIRDEVRQTAKKELRKQNRYYQNQQFNNRNNKKFKNKKKNNKNRQLNNNINQNNQMVKSAGIISPKKAQAAKDYLKQNVVANSLTSLAYAGAPALAFGAMNRDRYNFQKIDSPNNPNNPNNKSKTNKTVLEFKDEGNWNKEPLEKKASLKNMKTLGGKFKSNFLPDDFGKQMRDSAVRGLTNSIPVAMIAGATNRNWRGNLERFDSQEYAQNVARPLERGNIRITIERGDEDNNGSK